MFSSMEDAIYDIREGKMIVVIDDHNRENEGDLLMAAEKATLETINFMAKYGRGLICLPASKSMMDKIQLSPMVMKNTDQLQTAFTVSIDHKDTGTGISAEERAFTIRQFCKDHITEDDFKKPGHVFPLTAVDGGVLKRRGHTEAAVDFAVLAGLKPAGIICEIMGDDGQMLRTPDLIKFAEQHSLKIVTIDDLVEYRKQNEAQIQQTSCSDMPTKYGDFKIYAYVHKITGEHHVALVMGELSKEDSVLVRIHSECLTGDVFGSQRCDCGEQFDAAMKNIANAGCGVLVYMRQEGRGIGLVNKLKAYELQDQGLDTVEANNKLGFPDDMREYNTCAWILKDLGVKNVRIMTNNPRKIDSLEKYGISIESRMPIQIKENAHNEFYLKTKKEKLNHKLQF